MVYQPTGKPTGRPPGVRTQFKREIDAAQRLFADGLTDVAAALLAEARGKYILMCQTELGWERIKDEDTAAIAIRAGMVRVYLTDPDVRAGLEVLRRVMGEVPQQVNHDVRHMIEATVEDQATLVRILEEHVPPEYLAPVLAELRRVREHHRAAAGLLAG